MMSHLTRGAWIEIRLPTLADTASRRRTSHEVRGLKSSDNWLEHIGTGRTSHEVRGLK